MSRLWSPERDAQLTALWAEGVTTRLIGERMGISKNALIGRAHRIGLEGRTSPIIRGAEPKPKKDRRRPMPAQLPKAPATVFPMPGVSECQWPKGDGSPWRFCCSPAERGYVYCTTHRLKAYRVAA